MEKKIAVVGGGIGGLTAAYLLSNKYDVTLFEKDNRLGGCAYTHQTSTGELIDIGVADFVNPPARSFLRLCDELRVKMVRQPTATGISIHDLETNDGLYFTPGMKGLFAQRFALFRSPVSLSKLMWVLRKGEKLMDEGELNGLSYEEAFRRLPVLTGMAHSLPMLILHSLTGMDYEEILKAPAELFFDIFKAYGRFDPVLGMFRTYFPENLTRSYVEALASPYRDKVFLNSKIRSVARNNGTVTLKMEDGTETVFDKIVFACYADQALALLEKPTGDEKRLLGAWKYLDISTVVHRDKSILPRRELCQQWVFTKTIRNGNPYYSGSNCSWMAPAVSKEGEYISTFNPNFRIKENLIDFQTYFRLPSYDFNSFSTIRELPSLNGKMNSYYCGGYFGHASTHGPTVDSAIGVAKHLGIEKAAFDAC